MKLAKRVRPLLRHHEDVDYCLSLPYPYVFDEEFGVDVALPAARIPYEFHPVAENIAASVAVTGVLLRDLLSKMVVAPEGMTASVALSAAVVKDLLNKAAVAPESVSAAAAVTGALLKTVLIGNTTPPENMKASIAITGAVLADQ